MENIWDPFLKEHLSSFIIDNDYVLPIIIVSPAADLFLSLLAHLEEFIKEKSVKISHFIFKICKVVKGIQNKNSVAYL